jgi:ABC-type maltose transport system permease subunit
MFWPEFIREARLLFKYSRAVKNIQPELESQGLRIDYLGRVYTVVNLPEEYRNQPEVLQQSIVFKELKPTSDILMKYGLSDYAYPLIEKIRDDKAIAFLVVLYPETDYFNFWRFLWNSLFLCALTKVILLSINWAPQIVEWFQNL